MENKISEKLGEFKQSHEVSLKEKNKISHKSNYK